MRTYDEAAWLRRALRERGAVRGKQFEPELRARVIRFATQRRDDGASWMTIATELGACFETVRRWCVRPAAPAALAKSTHLRPVHVVADATIEVVAPSAMKVVTPNGLRVEGVSVEQVVALVRALG